MYKIKFTCINAQTQTFTRSWKDTATYDTRAEAVTAAQGAVRAVQVLTDGVYCLSYAIYKA
jgi:hypothetical protein